MKFKYAFLTILAALTAYGDETPRPIFATSIYNGNGILYIPTSTPFGNQACYFDANSTLASSITTATELSYLHGATSNIQAQIDDISGGGIDQLIGDVLAGPGSGAQTATLSTTGVTAGSYTNANITVDAKGRISSASNGSSSGTTWGSITGTLSNQTDLQSALNGKQNTGNYLTAITGDLSASGPGSAVGTLATVNSNTGTFGNSGTQVGQFTVNGKGLITAAQNTAITFPVTSVNSSTGAVTVNAINQLTGDATAGPATGSQSKALTLATVNSNVGTFGDATHVAQVTLNAKGLVTAASSVSITGSGNVSGPGSSTDTAIARFNGTSGALLENSGVLIDGSNNITGGTWRGSTVGVTYGGTGTGTAFTSGSVVFAGSGGTYSQDNANFYWDDSNIALGIGTTPSTTAVIDIVNNSGSTKAVQLTGYGSNVGVRGRYAQGTLSSPTAAQTSNILEFIGGRGYGATGFASTSTGAINIVAGGNFTDSSMPTYLQFEVTPSGSNTTGEAMRINSTGRVLMNTTTDDGSDQLQVNGSISASSLSTSGNITDSGTLSVTGATSLGGTLSMSGNTILSPKMQAYTEDVVSTTQSSAYTVNLQSANLFQITETGNVTLTFSNPPSSGTNQAFTLDLVQDSTGGRTTTFPGTVSWGVAGAPTLTTTANTKSIISCTTFDGGSSYQCVLSGTGF